MREKCQETLKSKGKLNDMNILRGLYESLWHMVIIHSDVLGC